ncbi:unnamed protein product [Discosporangium mesarthrocarpum]
MHLCSDVLTCHVLQGCIRKWVLLSPSVWKSSPREELERWFEVILSSALEPLEGKEPSEQQAMCSISLLQLCSMIITDESTSPNSTSSGLPSDNIHQGCASHGAEEYISAGKRIAQRVCAEVSLKRLMHRFGLGASQGVLVNATDQSSHERAVDILFWVLALLADVLEHVQTIGLGIRPSRQQRDVIAPASTSFDGERPSPIHGCERTQLSKADMECLLRLMASLTPAATLSPDSTLKWLEVAQILAGAARVSMPEMLLGLFAVVSEVIQHLSARGSIFPGRPLQEGIPGEAFVDERGASTMLSQAMLMSVFSMALCVAEGGQAQVEVEGDAAKQAKVSSCVLHVLETLVPQEEYEDPNNSSRASQLVHLFSERDDTLVEMLLVNIGVYAALTTEEEQGLGSRQGAVGRSRRRSNVALPPLQTLYSGHLHPGRLFAALIVEVGFDHSLLLDWVISPETSFLTYLTQLLRVAVRDWSSFVLHTAGVRLPLGQQRNDDRDREKEEEEVILSGAEADRVNGLMTCLEALFTSAKSLEERGLTPFGLSPLLRRMACVLRMYEGCSEEMVEEVRTSC